jgi:single-strand DNA-binding protein
MAGFNKVMLIGNLTRDPQLKYLPSNNTAVVEFGLACNRKWKTPNGEDREEVTFVDITAFGRQAEVLNQYCQKGKQIFIEGRLKFDSWEDKQGGGKRSKLSVVAENFQFLGGREGGGAPGGGGGGYESGDEGAAPAPPPRQARSAAPPGRAPQGNQGGRPQPPGPSRPAAPQPPYGDEEQFKDDDIPF